MEPDKNTTAIARIATARNQGKAIALFVATAKIKKDHQPLAATDDPQCSREILY